MSRKISNIDIEIGTRIKSVRKGLSLTGVQFADNIGISQGHLSDIENAKTPAGKPLILAISYIYNSNPEWLLTGEGEPQGVDSDKPPLNSALLREVIEVVELVLSKHGLVLDPPDKAEAVTVLYEMYLDSGKKPEERTTERMLRLVA